MLFTEELIEDIMENIEFREEHAEYFPATMGSLYEPPYPEEMEIQFTAAFPNVSNVLTAAQIENIEALKEHEHFQSYISLYAEQIAKEKTGMDESDWYPDTFEEDIELKIEADTLIIEFYTI